MTVNKEELLWFLQPPEKIQEMRDNLPPAPTPDADELLTAISLAREDREKVFLQSLIDYIKAGATWEIAIKAAKEDWDLL